MGVDFLDRRVLAKQAVDGRKPASGHESQLRQGVASGHPQGRSAAKEPQSGLTRRNPLTFDPTCCGFSHSLFAIYARFYAAVNNNVCAHAPEPLQDNLLPDERDDEVAIAHIRVAPHRHDVAGAEPHAVQRVSLHPQEIIGGRFKLRG